MSSEFDAYGRSYDDLVEHSIEFAGRDHDFYLEAKADALLDLVRRALGDPASLDALDVGCGGGLMHRFLGPLGKLRGVDVSVALVEEARAANPGVEYAVGDGTELPFPDDAFGLVFTVCVLHHVAPVDRPPFVAELARVVRPGGIVAVFEHNPLNPLTRLAVHRCAFDEDAVLLGSREATRRLAAAGLRPFERRYLLLTPWRGRVAAGAESLARGVPLGAQYYVAARA